MVHNRVLECSPMKKVVIYSTPTCGYCQLAKEFFREHEVAYEEHNVATDAVRRKEMVDKTGQLGVPVIVVSDADGKNEQVIIGFDETGLLSALGLK